MSRRLLTVASLILALAVVAGAQTFSPRSDTFAFDNTLSITSWDGVVNAYPYEMGSVSFTPPNNGVVVPWQLGYLNNGYLVPCDPMTWGAKIWVVGDGTHTGDTYTQPGSAPCPYFTGEYGGSGNSSNILDSFSVVVKYVRSIRLVCGRGGCHNLITDTLQGGTGTVQQALIN